MKRSALFRMALVCMAVAAMQNASAGSAVVTAGHGHLITSYGQPSKEIAKEHALGTARQRYGANVRVLAASDVTGYGAIAVAHKGSGLVNGIALGRPSRAEAQRRAIELCLKGAAPTLKSDGSGTVNRPS
jgi:hypothetical protein